MNAAHGTGLGVDWKPAASALAAGLLFGVGLTISGMTKADKVINFLDLKDAWDPSLALVMAGAIAVHLILFKLILRRESPLYGVNFGIPTRTDVDMRLVGGSALFGIGWAVGGFCPGPGLVSAASLAPQALVFVAALTGGMLIFQLVERGMAPKPKLAKED